MFSHSLSIACGQGLAILQQLLLPAAFLRGYGVEEYSQWLLMMAFVGQFNTLDFGLQTYVVNRLTLEHQAGNHTEALRVQSLGLQVIIVMAATVWLALALALWQMPVGQWLKQATPDAEIKTTILCLVAWLFLRMIQGQLAGPFRAGGMASRAQQWDNLQRAVLLGLILGGIVLRWPLRALAGLHLASALVTLAGMTWDLRRRLPQFWPKLHFLDWHGGWSLVRPSLFFGLGNLNQFLVFEMPLLVLNRTAGAQAVVAFSVGRTLFSGARQLLTPIQHAIFPEITRSYGRGDWLRTRELFALSEAVAWIGGATLVCALAVAAPVILRVWLDNQTRLEPATLALMAATGLAILLKDNKNSLQQATNRHERSMMLASVAYGLMVTGWWLVAPTGGLDAVIALWLIVETLLTCVLQSQNEAVLGRRESVTGNLFYPLALIGTGTLLFLLLWAGQGSSLAGQMCSVLFTGAAVALLSARLFRLKLPDLYRQFSLHFFPEKH